MPETHAELGPVRTEHTDVNIRGILYVGAGLAVVGVICALVSYWVFAAMKGREREGRSSQFPLAKQRATVPPEPRLEQIEHMKTWGEPPPRIYAEEEKRLKSYGWVDEKKGIVHIPIDQAMKILAEKKRLKSREK